MVSTKNIAVGESPFPKPSQDIEKCKRWLVACSRQFFICVLHWPGGKGPTAETPDLLKANLTPQQATRACAPKRKAPKPRREPVAKKEKLEAENDEILESAIEKAENDGIFESTIEKTDESDESQCLYVNTATGRLVSSLRIVRKGREHDFEERSLHDETSDLQNRK